MTDILYLAVDGQVIAHNANGGPFPEAKDYEKSISGFLPDDWKYWSIIRFYDTENGKKQ